MIDHVGGCACSSCRLSALAIECRRIVRAAVADLGADLGGGSAVDLCLDNLSDPRIGAAEVRSALRIAGADLMVSSRVSWGFCRG